jgi:hypothetical protein
MRPDRLARIIREEALMSAPPHGYGLTEDQLSGVACAGCGRDDRPLFAAGTIEIRGGEPAVQVIPLKRCDPCLPDERRMIVIASSSPEANR